MRREPKVLSVVQREQLNRRHEYLSELERVRYYTLSPEEIALAQKRRGDANRLGFALQLCYLRYPGRALQPQEMIPETLLSYVADQLDVPTSAFKQYAQRDTTRREHFREIQSIYGYQTFDQSHYADLKTWLRPTAIETDKAIVLVNKVLLELQRRKIMAPALSTVERLVWETRRQAEQQLFTSLTQLLSSEQKQKLDELTLTKDGKPSRLTWLKQAPLRPSPKSFKSIIERIEFIRQLSLDDELDHMIPQNRFLQLAREGSRYSNQKLKQSEPLRRYAVLTAFVIHQLQELTDRALAMHDRLMTAVFKQAKRKHQEEFQANGKAINEKVRLYATIGKVLIAAREQAKDWISAIESVISWERFEATVSEAEKLAYPYAFDYLEHLDNHYSYLRQYTPLLLDNFEFQATKPYTSTTEAIGVVRQLNQTGQRIVPETAPTDFVKPRWKEYVIQADKVDRHYYELCLLATVKDGLKSGDLSVKGSKQYRSFEDYLLPPEEWSELQQKQHLPTTFATDCQAYLAQRSQALDTTLKAITPLLMENKLTDVRLEDEKLIITPLTKLVPDAAEKLSHQVYQLLPRIRLTDLLIEVDAWTNFSEQFTHLNTDQTATQKQLLLSTILADAINLGHTRLAEACPGITADQLSWMSQWYLRPETYHKALAVLVNFQHQLPLAQSWGDGTTSSSDGQSFPIAHHRPHTAHINLKYGLAPTVVFYTHISDQYAPYHTKVISSIVRDAPHLLDGLLYHESNLAIREHYTDTAGFTDQVFAMCHLLGFNFAPRIRNLKDHKLFSILPSSTYPELKPLLSKRPINLARIEKHWDDILRLVSSIRLGTVPASLILGKLAAYPRQNGLALAVREIGRIERTLFSLEWLQNPHLRRRVQVGLNKGEARNGLAREVFKHRLGRIVDRSYQDQWHKASGLNLVVAAIILWNTVYLQQAVATLQQSGQAIPDTLLPHLSPLGWEHINMIGEYHWNLQLITTLEELKPLRLQFLKPEMPSYKALQP